MAGADVTAGNSVQTVKVWDPLVRIGHWLLAAAVLSNALELTRAGKQVHQVLGYVAVVVVLLRVVWGFVGPSRARFADFVPGPRRLVAYLRQVASRRDQRHLGHNPAGGAMAVALLAVVAATGLTGWLQTTDALYGVGWIEAVHGLLANLLIGLIVVHVLGAIVESLRFRENLVLAMITGRKRR